MSREFKVGDKVRVVRRVNDYSAWYDESVNRFGDASTGREVIRVYKSGNVLVDCDGEPHLFPASHLEPVTEEQQPEPEEIDPINKEYQTRKHGYRYVHYSSNGKEPRIYIGAYIEDGIEYPIRHTRSGNRFDDDATNMFDLVEVKPRVKRTVYLNVLKDEVEDYDSVFCYESREAADYSSSTDRVLCIKLNIDLPHGYGLNGDAKEFTITEPN
ncbi:hypothetical protein KOR42_05650 [Thalassoglobus neptunius]|uniref:Uncharacterized protein n=1 Tax=Thalassoglobus neptunius TaxID=1938619 RepID=A0A5C5X2F4_9PLAN|nr:hypothetical protein [Thalassoglobus neptunius]TWT57207.1 hypothetical protein KOR42_05650 [Thalassoglobus neptunius]